MSAPTEVHRRWAARLLAPDPGRGEPPAAAAAIEPTYVRFLQRAAAVIGDNGVRAIVSRSVKLAAAEHAALRPILLLEGYATDPVRALRSLRGQAAADATLGAVLATFLAMLSSFIGERLTGQIIEDAWVPSEEPKP